jgi:hydrogenase-4 component E
MRAGFWLRCPTPGRRDHWSTCRRRCSRRQLTLVACAGARPLVTLAPSASARDPVGLAVVLIGFFWPPPPVPSQIIGVLSSRQHRRGRVPYRQDLIVELGVSADLALAVLVLQILTSRLHETFGPTDLDELRELHD